MPRQHVCQVNDIPVGSNAQFNVNGEEVLVFHTEEGFFATQPRCTHLFASLKKGKMDGCTVRCPLHHACFDVRTGEVVKWANFPPGVQLLNVIRSEKALRTWPVALEGERVMVEY